MSDFLQFTGNFNTYNYKDRIGNKLNQRMAGDYMKDFANANANNKKDKQKDFTYQGSNGKYYGTNTERMLFGNTSNDGGKPSPKKETNTQSVNIESDTNSKVTATPTPASSTTPSASTKQFAIDKAQETINNYKGPKTAKEFANQYPMTSGMPSEEMQQNYVEYGKYAQAGKLAENPWKDFSERLGKNRMPNAEEIAEMKAIRDYQKKNPLKQQPQGGGRVGAFASPFH